MPRNPTVPDPASVIVIGAGAAGLGAARVLADAGVAVTVVEAKGHIGGRAWTSDLWPDLPVDMGASWIHGIDGNPLTELADALGAAHALTSYDRVVARDRAGRAVDFAAAAAEVAVLVGAARAAVEDGAHDIPLKAAVEALPAWAALSPDRRRLLRLVLHTRIEHEYSGDWSRLSAWHFDSGKDFGGGEAVMARGFGPVMAHLARGLDIRLNDPVLSIAPVAGGVEMATARGSHRAARAIVTLPLGVLKSGDVRFGAPLKKGRAGAIARLEMGLLNKCWLRFDRVFWPPGADWLNLVDTGVEPGVEGSAEPGPWPEFTSFLRPSGVPLLVGFNAAAPAEAVEALDDAATVAGAMAALRAMFGADVPDPVGFQISRWRQDRFARGAYSFLPVGARPKDRSRLAGRDWNGRLSFAGEATSRAHPGTVHGALMTGRRRAVAFLTEMGR